MTTTVYTKGDKVSLSEHFSSNEFDCACHYDACTTTPVCGELVNLLEQFRTAVGQPIHINSGYRCAAHNAEIGGEPHSQHLLGTAADIVRADKVQWGESDRLFAEEVCKNSGLGSYITPASRYLWLHIDSRNGKARWQKKV